jgi:hypothetical protein
MAMLRVDTSGSLSPAEVHALQDSVNNDPYWNLVVLLMTRTGLKSNELRWLDVDDLDRRRDELHVRKSHGGSQRKVPVGRKVIEAWDAHLEARPRKDEKALFPSRSSSRVSNRHLRNQVKALGTKAGIARDLHPQLLLPVVNVDDPLVRSRVFGIERDDAHLVGSRYEWLQHLIHAQRDLLITVALGEVPPGDADGEYRSRQEDLADGLVEAGLPSPFPWRSLWGWHTFYSQRLATPIDQRAYVDLLADSVLSKLGAAHSEQEGDVLGWTAKSWNTISDRLKEVRRDLADAKTLDDYQDVGRRCREIVIAVANLLFDDRMVPDSQTAPHGSNAKARIDLIIEALLQDADGRPELRALFRNLARSVWDLSQTVTHSSSAGRLDARASFEATLLMCTLLRDLETDSEAGRKTLPSTLKV